MHTNEPNQTIQCVVFFFLQSMQYLLKGSSRSFLKNALTSGGYLNGLVLKNSIGVDSGELSNSSYYSVSFFNSSRLVAYPAAYSSCLFSSSVFIFISNISFK